MFANFPASSNATKTVKPELQIPLRKITVHIMVIQCLRTESGHLIAEVPKQTSHYDEDIGEGSRITHLIAAAPEMLEALDRVMKAFSPNGSSEGMSSKQSLAIGSVMNAIAKARGEG